MVNAIV